MAITNLSRRALIRRLGWGAGGMALVGVGSACGPTSEHERREAKKRESQVQRAAAAAAVQPAAQATAHTNHGGAMVQASTAQQGTSADAMDRHHEEGIK